MGAFLPVAKNGLKAGVFDGYNGGRIGQPGGGAFCVGFGVSSTEGIVPEQLRYEFWGSNLGVFYGEMRGIKLCRLGAVGQSPEAVVCQPVAAASAGRWIDGEWSCSEVD